MAIVLLGGCCWFKPETTLAGKGSRDKAVECLGLKPCWEGHVPSASTMVGRRCRSNIFIAGQTSEMGGRCGPGLMASLNSYLIEIMTEFFQIARMSTQATERLRSSVRKARPCKFERSYALQRQYNGTRNLSNLFPNIRLARL